MSPPGAAHLPPLELTQRELDDLPEYSCSLPTGTTAGKRWKRDHNAYRPLDPGLQDKEAALLQRKMEGSDWSIGEFFEPTEEQRKEWGWPPEDIGIRWYKPVIVEGP